jgi:anti-anti-sigma factor
MTGATCNTMESVKFTASELPELVRGRDQDLIARVAPLARQHDVSLDLRDVERIDAAGIAALISLYGCARATGHNFAIANASARVEEILALVGLDQILLSRNAVQKSQSDDYCERSAA